MHGALRVDRLAEASRDEHHPQNLAKHHACYGHWKSHVEWISGRSMMLALLRTDNGSGAFRARTYLIIRETTWLAVPRQESVRARRSHTLGAGGQARPIDTRGGPVAGLQPATSPGGGLWSAPQPLARSLRHHGPTPPTAGRPATETARDLASWAWART